MGQTQTPTLAIQYLEPSPELVRLEPSAVRDKVRDAFQILPITKLIVGWDVPEPLLEVCAEEAQRADAQLLRWQPLLTSDNTLKPSATWSTIGLRGEPVPGYLDMPEFTFVCPNHPEASTAILDHLDSLAHSGRYDGIFLDRIRYPSPASDPSRWLACICPACQRKAAAQGIDLARLARHITDSLTRGENVEQFLYALLGAPNKSERASDADLETFLDFRTHSVTSFVTQAATLVRRQGLEVGLDCFSPSLTRMVGQDLATLDSAGDWIKPMSYWHTLGPAGVPFELLDLCAWLVNVQDVPEGRALAWLSQATDLELPPTQHALRHEGIPPQEISVEMARARKDGITRLLAGVELVEIPDVAALETTRIVTEHKLLRAAAVDGVVLSWDLWLMPTSRLKLIAPIWAST